MAVTKRDLISQTGQSIGYLLYTNGQIFQPGTGLVNESAISGANWTAAIANITEGVTSDAIGTGRYTIDFSAIAGLPANKLYMTVYLPQGSAPGAAPLVVDQNYWDGTNLISQSGDVYAQLPANFSTLTIANNATAANLTRVLGTAGAVIPHVTLCDTTTANTDMRGTDNAATAASLATAKTELDAVKAKTDLIPAVPASTGDAMTLTTAYNLYHCDIEYTRDTVSPKDEYTATFFKNGVRQTSGITVPTIEVIKRADGTDLVASTALTQIGTSGSYKYDEPTNVLVPPAVALILVTATVGGTPMTFSRLLGRDR